MAMMDIFPRRVATSRCTLPEEPKTSASAAAAKSVTDFDKLAAYWSSTSPIKEYFFVFNDKYQGSYPEIETNLNKLKKDKGLDEAGVFLAKDLEKELFELDKPDHCTFWVKCPTSQQMFLTMMS